MTAIAMMTEATIFLVVDVEMRGPGTEWAWVVVVISVFSFWLSKYVINSGLELLYVDWP